MSNITIIGSGQFGLAIGSLADKNDYNISFLCHQEKRAIDLNNKSFALIKKNNNLSSSRVVASADFIEATKNTKGLIITLPCQKIFSTFEKYKSQISKLKNLPPILLCSKGIDIKTCLIPYQIISNYWPSDKIAVLSGPNFADEILLELPSATTIAASTNINLFFAKMLKTSYFRPYLSSDPMGVSILGAIKNCVAIGAGLIESCQLGQNAKAAYITRSLYETKRLIEFYHSTKYPNIQSHTITGLAGLGDILLSCNSKQSRNFRLGLKIGSTPQKLRGELLFEKDTLVEGIHTISALTKIIKKNKLDMPILSSLNHIILGKLSVKDAIASLYDRSIKNEND